MRTERLGRWRIAAALGTLLLVSTACLGQGEDEPAAGGDGTGGDQAGGTVNILAAFIDEDQKRFEASLKPFEDRTGIDVVYEGAADFEQLVTTRVEGGNLPDIALFPQPGLFNSVAEQDVFKPLDDVVDLGALKESLVPGLLELGEVGGEQLAVPYRAAVKDLTYYPVPEFGDAGYAVPETQEDLQALVDQIKSDGGTPWCLGMESGAATGWVATDWIELFMLRLHGPDVYDQWVSHKVMFNSPEVTEAAEAFAALTFGTEGNVLEGRKGIVTTPFGDSPTPMFEDPPACFLHRQGSFITGDFPQDVQKDLAANVDFFYFPPVAEGGFDGKPVLGGADIAGLMSDSEAAKQTLEYLSSAESGEAWAKQGNFLSPHADFDPSLYVDDFTRKQGEILTGADVFRFDASDLMPGKVGAGTFWEEMVKWINDEKSLEEALQTIDASWPK